ncbi:MAG: type 4a pilus biogenesis protein PilO [candidate division Zixibacteria bacterium]|nr:type 4a pilus biogenesis protein PilO [candidate division Zixibacteria bacterium]
MDLKNPKTQKIVIAALACFIVGYFWYSRLYTVYQSKVVHKSQEFESITTDLKNVEMKAKSLDALKMEYEELIKRYHEIEALLPEVKQIPSMLVQLHTASSITGTRITKITPLPLTSEAFYNIASFEVELTGTFHDFGTFTSYVANFPFIANVSRMNLKSLNPTKAKSVAGDGKIEEVGKKKETLTATFVLSTYFVKEEERLKELTL